MHLTNKAQFINIFSFLINDNFVPFFQAVKFVNPSADTDAFEFTRKLHLPVKKLPCIGILVSVYTLNLNVVLLFTGLLANGGDRMVQNIAAI